MREARPLFHEIRSTKLSYDKSSLRTDRNRRSGKPHRSGPASSSDGQPRRNGQRRFDDDRTFGKAGSNGHRHRKGTGTGRGRQYNDRAASRPRVDEARRAAIAAFDPATSAFGALGVADRIVKILGVDGITEPTPVQAAVIPDAIGRRDVLGRARTGSGKTLAFGLPMIERLAGASSEPNRPRGLIVVPTRELAGQVTASLEPLADALRLRMVTVYGGVSYDRQIRRLDRGVDIVVATPGRLDDLIRKGACDLDAVEVVTLDEADHLCDLGFYPVIDDLVSQTPEGGQRLLLSATLDGDVDRLVRRHLSDPARHEFDPDGDSVTTMDHHVLVVGHHEKLDVAADLVRAHERSIVFTRTKDGAMRLAEDFEDAGVRAVDLHGDLSQRVRERNLDRFRRGQAQVVVATDVAARGIHVDDVGLVVHYDPAGEAKAYLHRSGRTARAGASGAVVTMATRGQASRMGEMFTKAGVTAKNVDVRSVDGPLSSSALAAAPEMMLRPQRQQPKNGQRRNYRGGPAKRPRRW